MMLRLPTVLILALACTTGCRDGGEASTRTASEATPPVTQFSNDLIAGKVYAPQVSVPAQFQRDLPNLPGVSFTLRHLRVTDLDPTIIPNSELCHDDMNMALSWSDAAVADPVTAAIITVAERDEWFEITRESPQRLTLHRVFKCRYLNRDGVDPATHDGPAGKVSPALEPASAVRQVAEYLWHFSPYSNPGAAVLDSVASYDGTRWSQTLKLAVREPAAGQSDCDQIQRIDWTHALGVDGTLTTQRQLVRTFEARMGSAGPEVCAAR